MAERDPADRSRRAGLALARFVRLLAACLLLAGLLPACLPASAPLVLPSDTPLPPTLTPTATVVWFPPTATPTPFDAPLITPTLALNQPAGELIFQDNFSDGAAWPLARTASSSIALGVDELTLALTQPRGYLYAVRGETQLGDFSLEITASPSICRGQDEYGLLLRVSPDLEFYRFALSCDGQVRLDKYYQGKASSPQPWIYSGQVPPGAPSQSRLGVTARGREMAFYVNGEQQFSASDPSLATGSVGVFIRAAGEESVTVSFSDLRVYFLSE